MLTIFQLFAARTEASVLDASPYEYLHKPILEYLEAHGAKIHTRHGVVQFITEEGAETRVTGLVVAKVRTETITADAYVCACDVPGIQRLYPGVAEVV